MNCVLRFVSCAVITLYVSAAYPDNGERVEVKDMNLEELTQTLEQFHNDRMDVIERVLPELHSAMTSDEWDQVDGFEKFQTVANNVANAWGADDTSLTNLSMRIDEFAEKVDRSLRSTVEYRLESVSEILIERFVGNEIFFGLWEIADKGLVMEIERFNPDYMTTYRSCIDQATTRLQKKSLIELRKFSDGAFAELPDTETKAVSSLRELEDRIFENLFRFERTLSDDYLMCMHEIPRPTESKQ